MIELAIVVVLVAFVMGLLLGLTARGGGER